MDENTMKRLWGFCLLLIGVTTLILASCSLADIVLPDFITRVLGITDLILLPVFIFLSVRIFKK